MDSDGKLFTLSDASGKTSFGRYVWISNDMNEKDGIIVAVSVIDTTVRTSLAGRIEFHRVFKGKG
jgi:hypothetical protein